MAFTGTFHDFTNDAAAAAPGAGGTPAGTTFTDLRGSASVVAAVAASGTTPAIPGHLAIAANGAGGAGVSWKDVHIQNGADGAVQDSVFVGEFIWQAGEGYRYVNPRYQGSAGSQAWYTIAVGNSSGPDVAAFKVGSNGASSPAITLTSVLKLATTMTPNQLYRLYVYCVGSSTVYLTYFLTAVGVDGVERLQAAGTGSDSSSPLGAGVGTLSLNVAAVTWVKTSWYNLAATTTSTITGDAVEITKPDGLAASTPVTLFVMLHGSGGTASQYRTLNSLAPVLWTAVKAGCVTICQTLGGNHWANDAAQALASAGVANALASFNVTRIILYGASMGGDLATLLMINSATLGTVPIAGGALNSAATSPTYMHDSGGFGTEINTAYTNSAGWTAAQATHDPDLILEAGTGNVHSIPTLWILASDDATVPAPNNSARAIAKVNSSQKTVRYVTGGHVPILAASPAEMAALTSFINAPQGVSSGGAPLAIGY